MPVFACTMFLEIPRLNTGWSETWYRNFADSQAAITAFRTVADARLACLGQDGVMLKIRVSDVAVTGDSSEHRQFVGEPLPNKCNFASVGFLYRYESNDLNRSERVIRGLPREAFDPTFPRQIILPNAAQAVAAYNVTLINAYGFRVKKRSPAVPEYVIKQVDYDPVQHSITLTTLTPNTFVVNDYINVTGLRQYLKAIRGIQRVLSRTDTTVTYAVDPNIGQPVLEIPYNGKGRVKKVEYDYPLVTRAIPQRWTDRQSGRPFDLQVGRV